MLLYAVRIAFTHDHSFAIHADDEQRKNLWQKRTALQEFVVVNIVRLFWCNCFYGGCRRCGAVFSSILFQPSKDIVIAVVAAMLRLLVIPWYRLTLLWRQVNGTERKITRRQLKHTTNDGGLRLTHLNVQFPHESTSIMGNRATLRT